MAAPMGLSSHTCSLSATGLMTKKKKTADKETSV